MNSRFEASGTNFGRKLVGAVAVAIGMFASGLGCATDVGDEKNVEESAEALASGTCDRASFAKCVNNKGGGACAKFCTGACQSEVAACARSGGGQGCVNKCTGSANTCYPREEYTIINTWECGYPYGWGKDNYAAPGQARATCTRQCDGSYNNCTTWKERNGRAVCTGGVPLDASQNPW